MGADVLPLPLPGVKKFLLTENIKKVIANHIPKTCVKEINVLSYRYFNAENKKHLILGTTNKPHLAMKLVSPMQ